MEFKYDFSIIMSVYNVEEYIDEAIESLLAQKFDFEKVQLILVDDGSTDSSGKKCDEYSIRYPENIIVVHKTNGGLASAKNEGLKHIKGKYVNFFDPDDILSSDTLKLVWDFFECHEEETDVVSVPMYFFEAQRGDHPLNYKFKKGSRVIDLNNEYNCIQTSGASAFYKYDAIKYIHFDEELLTSEDLRANLQVLLEKQTLGVVAKAKYHYRRRNSSNQSLLVSSRNDKKYYIGYLVGIVEHTISQCLSQYGHIPRFVQYTLMYDLGWKYRTSEIPVGVFNCEELKAYQDKLFGVLKYIDDDIIMRVDNIDMDTKYFLRWVKASQDKDSTKADRNSYIWLQDRNVSVILDFLEMNDAEAVIEGRITAPVAFGRPTTIAEANCEILECETAAHGQEIKCSSLVRSIRYPFRIKLKFNVEQEKNALKLKAIILGREIELHSVSCGKYFPITNAFKSSYFCSKHIKLQKEKGMLSFYKIGRKGKIRSEISFLKELWKSKKLGARKACLARALYWVLKPLKKKQIWLISDKADKADDNGEVFFEYVESKRDKSIKAYFLLNKDSADYARVKKIGKVIPYMSRLHKFIYLFADYTISAYSHNEINNPFEQQSVFYLDILHNCRYVFLQHGVIKDDMSVGLNRYHKGIFGFITSAMRETDSVRETCFYQSSQMWELGLPRYDKLYNAKEKVISIMPTWRRYLFGDFEPKNDRWILKDKFEESQFYLFYQSLVNDGRLLENAQKYGYKIQFVPHSVFFPYIEKFCLPDQVTLVGYGKRYRDIFAESALVVTDYSSVAFDVAYLKKPVIYTHFDKDEFFAMHGYKPGYFDYVDDGFGEVEYDLDSTVQRIIEYMESNCAFKDKYRNRVESFFTYNDCNNCKRVYEKIKSYQENYRERNISTEQ